MAEVELERLVVRLMGDGSDYKDMMDGASQQAEDFSSAVDSGNKDIASSSGIASDEIANSAQSLSLLNETSDEAMYATNRLGQSQGVLEGVNRQAGRALTMTGRSISQLGVATSMLNPVLGQSVMGIGMMASSAGQAVRQLDLMHRSGGVLLALFKNPWFQIGAPIAVAAGVAYAAYKLVNKESEAAIAKAEKLNSLLAAQHAEAFKKEHKEISELENPVEKAKKFGEAAAVARREYEEALAKGSQMKTKIAGLSFIEDWTGYKTLAENEKKNADEQREEALKRMKSLEEDQQDVINQTARAYDKQVASLISLAAAENLEGAEKAGALAFREANLKYGDRELANNIKRLEVEKYMNSQRANFRREMEKGQIESQNLYREMIAAQDPQNELLQSAVAVANAYDLWAQANKDLAKDLSISGEKKAELVRLEEQRMALKKLREEIDLFKQDLRLGGAKGMDANSSEYLIAMQNFEKGKMGMPGASTAQARQDLSAGGASTEDSSKQAQKTRLDMANYLRQLLGVVQQQATAQAITLQETP